MQLILTEYDEKKHLSLVARNARKEGIVEGKAEGKAEDILDLLSESGIVPVEIEKKIMQEKDIETLRSWLKIAAKVHSIKQFISEVEKNEE